MVVVLLIELIIFRFKSHSLNNKLQTMSKLLDVVWDSYELCVTFNNRPGLRYMRVFNFKLFQFRYLLFILLFNVPFPEYTTWLMEGSRGFVSASEGSTRSSNRRKLFCAELQSLMDPRTYIRPVDC